MSMDSSTDTEDQFATNMATVIRTVMQIRGLKASDGYSALHVSKGTWFSHLRSGAFSAWQLAQLARLLDVPVADLYSDPADLFNLGSC